MGTCQSDNSRLESKNLDNNSLITVESDVVVEFTENVQEIIDVESTDQSTPNGNTNNNDDTNFINDNTHDTNNNDINETIELHILNDEEKMHRKAIDALARASKVIEERERYNYMKRKNSGPKLIDLVIENDDMKNSSFNVTEFDEIKIIENNKIIGDTTLQKTKSPSQSPKYDEMRYERENVMHEPNNGYGFIDIEVS